MLEVFFTLLQRLRFGQSVGFISFDETQHWPIDALNYFLNEKLIEAISPAQEIVCPGCEQACFKKVHSMVNENRPPKFSIPCDETDFMGFICVDPESLRRWRITDTLLVNWFARKMGLMAPKTKTNLTEGIVVGLLLVSKSYCQLVLQIDEEIYLLIDQHKFLLSPFLKELNHEIHIDQEALKHFARHAIKNSNRSKYQPNTTEREERKNETRRMYSAWNKTYKEKKKANPSLSDSDIAKSIAKMEIAHARDWETIRRNMK